MAPQGFHEGASVCSLELCVPGTLLSLLHCLPLLRRLTAGPRKPRQETLFHAKVRPPPAPRFETHAGLAAPSPGNSVHILFWSVGDLFTQRSRFLLHTHFMLQKQRRETRCVPGSWLPSPGGEGEMPGLCLNIYHILVLVRLGERKLYREGMLFNRVHRGSMSLHLRGGLLTIPPLAQVASLLGLTLPPGGGPTPPRLSFPRFSTRWSRVPSGPSNFGSLSETERMWRVKGDGVVSKFSNIFRSRSTRGSTT